MCQGWGAGSSGNACALSLIQSSSSLLSLTANGTTLPIHPCSLLPPEGLEMAEAGLTEYTASMALHCEAELVKKKKRES
ncbi:Hypothetical predicted protein [Podarcis lilfordi]|uniref:Uncharacterized protein n=1 Tax=Podarcis lilfordi TaxID=74358 RepID=A0AA35P0J4_9SAUR|nr:Hypothetical predicted protein [Podarcis lilfordi]